MDNSKKVNGTSNGTAPNGAEAEPDDSDDDKDDEGAAGEAGAPSGKHIPLGKSNLVLKTASRQKKEEEKAEEEEGCRWWWSKDSERPTSSASLELVPERPVPRGRDR